MDWYKGMSAGKSEDAGTKLMGSGGVKKRAFGNTFRKTAREILEDYAGGMRDGLNSKLATRRRRDRLPDR